MNYLLVFGIIVGYIGILYIIVNLYKIEKKELRKTLNESLIGIMPMTGPGGTIFKLKTYRDLHAETSYNRPYMTHQFLENEILTRLDGPAVIWPDGRKEWWQNGQRHRLDGPAVIWPDGRKEWWQNGRHHRLDGPAVIWPDGEEEWWQNGQRHRLDGPAVIWPDGSQMWWQNGRHHRLDGPANIYADGGREWYVNDEEITPQVEDWMQETGVSWPFDKETVVLFKLRFL